MNIPLDLWPALEHKMKKEGYPSVAAGLVANGTYDVMIDRPHHGTGGIYNFTLEEQDRIFRNTAAKYFKGQGESENWYERKMEGLIEKAALQEKIPPSRIGHQILQMLANPVQEDDERLSAKDEKKEPKKRKSP